MPHMPQMTGRLLDMGVVSPLKAHSIFHGVTQAMAPDAEPVITLMRPGGTFVSVGYFQETEREVDLEFCRAQGIPVFRRHVGGGAVLLDQNQLFFHVMLPRARAQAFGLPNMLEERFEYLARPAILAYRRLGVGAAFRPINDIQVAGRKIGGTGVGEIGEGLVFAGSMMLDFDTALMSKVLRIPDEKMRDKVAKTLDDYMTTLKKELHQPPPVETVGHVLVEAFEEAFGLHLAPGAMRPEEMAAMTEWEATLQSPDWLHHVRMNDTAQKAVKISAQVKVVHAAHKAPGGMIRATARVVDGLVKQVLFSGDFPCTPSTALTDLAVALEGSPLDADHLKARLRQALGTKPYDLAGVKPEDFHQVLDKLVA